MDNKRINVLVGFVVVIFLAITIILIKDFKAQRAGDMREYKAVITNIVRMKNDKIRSLYMQLLVQEKENQNLKSILSVTRNDLDTLSKKLAQQAPVPAAAPAPVVATK